MEQIKPFASREIRPYPTNVSDAVETNWTIKAAVSVFAAVALASFCSTSLQTFHSSTTFAQQLREQFNHVAKVDFFVFAKTPTKVCVRKSTAQQPVQLFCPSGDVSSRRINLPACSLCTLRIHGGIACGGLTLRERAPPV